MVRTTMLERKETKPQQKNKIMCVNYTTIHATNIFSFQSASSNKWITAAMPIHFGTDTDCKHTYTYAEVLPVHQQSDTAKVWKFEDISDKLHARKIRI
jgi:hypothetical protein